MLWFLLLLGHLVGIVSYTLLLRKSATGKLNKLFLAALLQTGIFLPSVVFLLIGKVSFSHSPQEWLSLMLGGCMLTGLVITNVFGLAHLDASVFTIIYNLRLFVTTILGYLFLRELPQPLQIGGGILIFLSIFVLNLHKNKQWRSKSILMGFLAMGWFSFHAVLEKYNLQLFSFETYFFTFSFIGTILMWLIVWIKKVNIADQIIHIKDKRIYLLLFARALSAYAYTYALKFGSLAVTNYVSGMSVALIVLFGIFILKETQQIRQKLSAVTIALVGLTLILISKLFLI